MRRIGLLMLAAVLVLSIGSDAFSQVNQANTLMAPFALASKFSTHVNSYESLKDKAQERVVQEQHITQEWFALNGMMLTALTTEERLKVTGELYDLYKSTKDPGDRKMVRETITTILGHYAKLTDAEIRETGFHARLTNCTEQNDEMLTDLLAAKSLFEQLPDKLN